MNMVELIQTISKNQMDAEKPMQLMFGTVVSDGEPLRVRLSEKVVLEEEMLVRISRRRYERGAHLFLLRDHGGQRWYVLEVPGHNELPGVDREDCHPIGAITGLRAELDDHDDRLNDLEYDMNEVGGKVPVLTGLVSALEAGKSDKGHTHSMHEVSGLDEAMASLPSESEITDINDRIDRIVAQGGEPNIIETVRQNGTALPVTDKAVDVTVPAKVSDLTNDSGYQTAQQVQAAIGSGLASLFEADTYGPAAAVSFEAEHGGLPLKSCVAEIVAEQTGSGEPSPTNVRPISGWTGCNLSVSGADTSNPTVYSVSWQTEAGTVYGGTLDALTGVLTVTHWAVSIATAESTTYGTSGSGVKYLDIRLQSSKLAVSNGTAICSGYAQISNSSSTPGASGKFKLYKNAVTVYDSRFSSKSSAETTLTNEGFVAVYPLATPVTYQLTPQQITALAGDNNMWADTGDITVEYGAFLAALQREIEMVLAATDGQ